MYVRRAPLPGSATIVVFGRARNILLDQRLTRDEASLAISGVLPDVHPDVVDHWLDEVFERRRLPFTARQLGMLAGAAMAVTGLFTPHTSPHHHHIATARSPIVLSEPIFSQS